MAGGGQETDQGAVLEEKAQTSPEAAGGHVQTLEMRSLAPRAACVGGLEEAPKFPNGQEGPPPIRLESTGGGTWESQQEPGVPEHRREVGQGLGPQSANCGPQAGSTLGLSCE